MSSSRELKLRAKSVIRVRLRALIVAAAVYLLVSTVISTLTAELTGVNGWMREVNRVALTAQQDILAAKTQEEMQQVINSLKVPALEDFYRGPFAMVLAMLLYLMAMPLQAGYRFHTLQESRGTQTKAMSVFYGFGQILWKSIVIGVINSIAVSIASMFLVVPGVILYLRWSMALYILVDDPTKGPIQCLHESAQLMRGNKWRYLKLEFSFLGWAILSSLVTEIIYVPVMELWLMPYVYLAKGAFYNEIASLNIPNAQWEQS